MKPEPKSHSEGMAKISPNFVHGLDYRIHGYFASRRKKQYVIDGLIALDELSVVYGDPAAGKGNFALSMALAAASCETWFGRNAGVLLQEGWCPAGVVYFALERAGQVERRISAFARDRALEFDLPIAVVAERFDIRSDRAAAEMSQTVWDAHSDFSIHVEGFPGGSYKPDVNLIIVDTLAQSLGSGNDSDPGDIGAMLHTLAGVRERTGVHTMLIHHTPTNGDDRMRGHGSLNAACDTTIHVGHKRGQRVGSLKKNSDGPELPKFYFSLKTIENNRMWDDNLHDGHGDFVDISPAPVLVEEEAPKERSALPKVRAAKSDGPTPAKSEQPVLDALASVEPATEEQWRAAFDEHKEEGISGGAHRKRFSVGKPKLEAKGLVQKDEAGLYTVTVTTVTE